MAATDARPPSRPAPPRLPLALRAVAILALVTTFSALIAWPAAAQADIQVIESSIDITLPLNVEKLTTHYVRAPTSAAPSAPQMTACGSDHFEVRALEDIIYFQENINETGCGEARFRLHIPDGAKELSVQFNTTRDIESLETTLGDLPRPLAMQRLNLIGDPSVPLDHEDYFKPDDGPSVEPRPVRSKAFSLQQEEREDIILGWYFADNGRTDDPTLPLTPTGHRFEASVRRPAVTWAGVPMPLAGPADSSESIIGTEIETRFRLAARIHVADFLNITADGGPYRMEGARFTITIKVAEQNRLLRVVGPDGEAIDSSGFELNRASGILAIKITESTTSQHGEGLYTMVFSAVAPVHGSETFKPFAVFLLFTPIPVGAMAWLAARRFQRRVGRAFATTTLMLKAGVVVASVYYVLVLFFALRADRIELLSSWPLPAEGGLLYGLLLLAFVAFVALWLFGDRYLTKAMGRSIAEHERMGRELKERSGELESFVYAVSHDLKTPLVSLEWLVHSLEEAMDGPGGKKEREDSLRQILGRIHANIDGMDSLISDLLELSRVGRVEGAAAPVDLADTVGRVVDGVEAQLAEHGARVEVAAATLPVVFADRTRIEQVLRNLIVNAINYGRMRDGHIRVRAWLEEREHLDDVLHIEVDDNGPGVPAEFREQIFLLFQRAPDPYGRPIQGTGVGLALARKIARSYGGDLTVADSDLGGARFDFTFPAGRIVPERRSGTSAPQPHAEPIRGTRSAGRATA